MRIRRRIEKEPNDQLTLNQRVQGSSPCAPTKISKIETTRWRENTDLCLPFAVRVLPPHGTHTAHLAGGHAPRTRSLRHPIWFGVIIVMRVELGLIHPPVGMNVFVIKSVVQEVSFSTIFRGVLPLSRPILFA